jgi:hypothetical protein
MELTPIYSQLPIDAPKHDPSVSKSKSSVIVEGYSVSTYRVRDDGGEYSTSKKADSSNGACHTPPENIKDEIPQSLDWSTKEPLLGDSEDNPSNLDKQREANSKNATTYSRKRKWGEGNGYIEWRTITKNGKEYNQAYYHWKDHQNKYSRYIPKKLLGLIQEADKQKRPVTEILHLLGVASSSTNHNLLVGIHHSTSTNTTTSKNNSGSDSNSCTQFVGSENEEKHPLTVSDYISPPSHSKTRRHKGDGSGYIQWKTITVNRKQYSQPWYHYEFWNHRERVIKSSRYIPKQLLAQVIQLDADKVPVQEILNLLGVII